VPDREVGVRCGPWIPVGCSGHVVAHIPEQPRWATVVDNRPAQQIFQRFLPGPVPDITRGDVEPSTVRPSLDQDVVPTGHQETDQAYRLGSDGRPSGQYDVGTTLSGYPLSILMADENTLLGRQRANVATPPDRSPSGGRVVGRPELLAAEERHADAHASSQVSVGAAGLSVAGA
jgi:hypothetical protein